MPLHDRREIPVRAAFWAGIAIVATAAFPPRLAAAHPPDLSLTGQPGPLGMPEPLQRALLVDYYQTYLDDADVDDFRSRVSTRYAEPTLARLVRSPDAQARRAAVLALGLTGTMASNAVLASALEDDDEAVRELATEGLWSVWFRADTAENNAALKRVAGLISAGRIDEAEQAATRLILRAPGFAEAYNQRAITLFAEERYAESASDCRRALELNPYHIGALGGLAQCALRLGDRDTALEAFRKALKLQPHEAVLRQVVETLEAGDR